MFKKWVWFCGLLVSTIMAMPAFAVEGGQVIYLLRHAEKISAQADGELTANGKRRAENIAAMLKDVGVKRIYSTDYKRTQQTAMPLAVALSLVVESYNPRLLAEFAKQLKAASGVSVVVGHSNTTPNLVSMLGGDPIGAIAEDEFSRLYQLTLNPDGTVRTVLLRSVD